MPKTAAPTDPRQTKNPTLNQLARVRPVVRHPVVLGAVVLAVAWILAAGSGSYQQYVISLIVIYAIVGAGLVLLVGVGGLLSLGNAAFFAVGAYTAANIASRTNLGLPLELIVAVVIASAVGALVGLPSLRLSGLLLAAGTLALGFAAQQVLLIWTPVTGGNEGLSVGALQVFGRPVSLVSACFAVLAVCLVLTFNILRGRSGRALHALRTADMAARSVGIEVERRRIIAFALSGALTAAGGVLYGHAVSFLSPETFDYSLSIQLIIIIIIGGQTRLLGAVLGAAFVIGLPEQFRGVQKYEGILYGVLLLGVIIFAPGGVVQLVDRSVAMIRRGANRVLHRPGYEAGAGDVIGRGDPAPSALIEAPVASHVGTALADAGERLSVRMHHRSPADRIDGGADNEGEAPRAHHVSASGLQLEIDEVSVRFGGVQAVDGVSLTVCPGDVLGLIGPNGAGKTTLFNAVCGAVRAQGSIRFGETELSGLPVRRRAVEGIGRTFQNLSLHEGLTPLDHVMIGRHRFFRYGLFSEMLRLPKVIRSEREGRDEAMALLELVGLADMATVRADDLPYGMQKRVDVARALAARPRLLLLDEPAAGLPHDEADMLIDHVLELTRPNGTTVVIIEHNVELVRRVCNRMVAMAAGGIIASGSPEETLRSPEVVEAYLGG